MLKINEPETECHQIGEKKGDLQGLEIVMLTTDSTLLTMGKTWHEHGTFQPPDLKRHDDSAFYVTRLLLINCLLKALQTCKIIHHM